MRSRLDRYDKEEKKVTTSRLQRNQNLYDDINNKIGFEKIVDFNTQTRIELSSLNDVPKSRESYQQLKDYQGLIKDEPKEEIPKIIEEKEKVFDINTILEEARKNRNDIDELESKRKLKNDDYNVLSDLNKKYLSQSNDTKEKDEYEGLEELINTITSKTLAADIKKEESKDDGDLLGDLVATSVDLQVKAPENYEGETTNSIAVKIDADEDDDDNDDKKSKMDDSFYTRSMDLSEEDFNFDEKKERRADIRKGILIFLIVVVLLAIIGVVVYFLLQHFNIDIQAWLKQVLEP